MRHRAGRCRLRGKPRPVRRYPQLPRTNQSVPRNSADAFCASVYSFMPHLLSSSVGHDCHHLTPDASIDRRRLSFPLTLFITMTRRTLQNLVVGHSVCHLHAPSALAGEPLRLRHKDLLVGLVLEVGRHDLHALFVKGVLDVHVQLRQDWYAL